MERERDRQFTRIGDFGKFCLLRDQELSHWDSSVVCGVPLVFEPCSLYSSLKYVKLGSLSHTLRFYKTKGTHSISFIYLLNNNIVIIINNINCKFPKNLQLFVIHML